MRPGRETAASLEDDEQTTDKSGITDSTLEHVKQ
jgi:hypothetical protein